MWFGLLVFFCKINVRIRNGQKIAHIFGVLASFLLKSVYFFDTYAIGFGSMGGLEVFLGVSFGNKKNTRAAKHGCIFPSTG